MPTPRQILEVLLPDLKVAAAYAHHIQPRIAAQPAKDQYESTFAAALTDADLSIQTMIEVALLGTFPNVRFYGEEHEQSYNTKYFRAIDLGPQDDYLVTLDPIDGTKFYLDGHQNYYIILCILNADEYEAVIALSPAQNVYYYALRGQGAYRGTFEDSLNTCQPLKIDNPKPVVYLGWQMNVVAEHLKEKYTVISLKEAYSQERQIPNHTGIISGELMGSIMGSGKFIDGAAIAFIAQEAGYIVTTFEGQPLPALSECQDYQRPGLLIASSEAVHDDLLAAVRYL